MEKNELKPRGTFMLVDDDLDEHELFELAMKSLAIDNPVKMFSNGSDAYEYLRTTKDRVFMVLSDLNMPGMDGLALKRLIDTTPEIKLKSVPFFFHSNSGSIAEIRTAYTMNIQGFFRKATDFETTVSSLRKIIDLWTSCVHPEDLTGSFF